MADSVREYDVVLPGVQELPWKKELTREMFRKKSSALSPGSVKNHHSVCSPALIVSLRVAESIVMEPQVFQVLAGGEGETRNRKISRHR